jgi:hypothetical protein
MMSVQKIPPLGLTYDLNTLIRESQMLIAAVVGH